DRTVANPRPSLVEYSFAGPRGETGRHGRLKICCPHGRGSSTLPEATFVFSSRGALLLDATETDRNRVLTSDGGLQYGPIQRCTRTIPHAGGFDDEQVGNRARGRLGLERRVCRCCLGRDLLCLVGRHVSRYPVPDPERRRKLPGGGFRGGLRSAELL